MKTMILHDDRGHILSVSKVGDLKAAGSKFTSVGMVPGAGQHLIEVELSAEDERRALRDLHDAYRVERLSQRLVKKSH